MRKSAAAVASAYDVVDVAFETRLVPIAEIIESPLNPRKHKPELEDGFLQSIATDGVIKPVLLRPFVGDLPTGSPTRYELVDGEQRFRACLKVGRTHVPATVREVRDEMLIMLALAANKSHPMHAIDEARAYADLQTRDRVYVDLKVLASKVGRSATYVRDRLSLLRLEPLVLEALDAGVITPKHAEIVADAAPDQQRHALEECFSRVLTVGKNEHVPVAKALEKKNWDALKLALLGTRDVEKWVRGNAKRALASPEVQQVLRPAVELSMVDAEFIDDEAEQKAVEGAIAKVLQLSTLKSWYIADGAGVIGSDKWKVVKKGQRCDHAARGIVCHPVTEKPRVLDVCANSKCSKHYPQPKPYAPSTSSSYKPPKKSAATIAKEKKAAAEHDARAAWWKKYEKAASAAVATHVLNLKFTAKAITAFVWSKGFVGEPWSLKEVKKSYGVTLTDKNVLPVLILSLLGWRDQYESFREETERLGFDWKAFEKTHPLELAKDETAKADAKKPAKKGGAKK